MSVQTLHDTENIDVVLDDLVTALGAELMYDHNRNQTDNRKRFIIDGNGRTVMAEMEDFEDSFQQGIRPVLKPRDFLNDDGTLKEQMQIPVWSDEGHVGQTTVEVQPQ